MSQETEKKETQNLVEMCSLLKKDISLLKEDVSLLKEDNKRQNDLLKDILVSQNLILKMFEENQKEKKKEKSKLKK